MDAGGRTLTESTAPTCKLGKFYVGDVCERCEVRDDGRGPFVDGVSRLPRPGA